MDVAPIIRDNFVYRDTLFVNIGEGKRHPRASVTELSGLLLPAKGEAPKDQVAHWYEAQLLHYGLPRSKDKNTAKMRLMQAINRDELKVPSEITKMEAEMKKEYANAIRKAKLALKAKEPDKESNPQTTKIIVKADGLTIHVERSVSTPIQAAPGKTTAKPRTQAKPKEAKDKPVPKEKPAQTAKTATQAKSAPKERSAAGAKPSGSDLQKTATSKTSAAAKTTPSAGTTANRPPQTARRGGKLASASRASTYGSPLADFVQLTGVWDATCPELERLFPLCVGNLRLFLCVDNENDKLWGGFSLAYQEGVFLLDHLERAIAGSGIYSTQIIRYRARDLQGGSLAFHGGCVGRFRIETDGTIGINFRALFPEFDEIFMTARRRSGPLWCGKSEARFQEEWDAFVQETYGRPIGQTGHVRVKREEEEYGGGCEEEDCDHYEDSEWDD